MTYDEAFGLAKKLVERMTPEEMISQLLYNSPAQKELLICEHSRRSCRQCDYVQLDYDRLRKQA